MTTSGPTSRSDADGVTVHVDDVDELLGYAARSTHRTDLVVTPEQLHARNLKRRLSATSRPRSSLQFCDLSSVASDVLTEAGDSATALDRIDRIRTLETLLDERPDEFRHFEPLFGTRLSAHVSTIESARATVDAVTGYDPGRLDALDELIETTPPVSRRDARSLVEGAVATERLLASTTDAAVSGDAVLRAATTSIRETSGVVFEAAYPEAERLHLAGVSSVAATLRDFLLAVAEETAVDVRLFARAGTGPGIAGRLQERAVTPWHDRALPSVSLDVPVTEMVATTREQEARLAVALVTRLADSGISLSDILVVARDVDGYERALCRAARQYRQPLSLWTQLSVTETRPYTLVESVCRLLDARDGPFPLETLCRPLFAEWVDPDGETPSALPRRALDDARDRLGRQTRSLSEWRTRVAETTLPEQVERWLRSLLSWAAAQPLAPEPTDVRETFTPLLDAYRELVLLTHRERDDESLAETTESARALVRLERLVDDVAAKYEAWLDRGQTDRTWEAVQYLFETIATVKPGRREHANAGVVDVVDATDAWARTEPYVVVLGLVDGVWPLPPEGLFPVEVRDTLLGGSTTAARRLAPREGWTVAREFDHFADAVSTATDHLVCTRHERAADGSDASRSPFFDAIDVTRGAPTRIGQAATTRLLSHERTLPDPLAGLVGRESR
ncbi:ATP-dependent helicase/nuclease subunit B [Halogranum rubrum]|uniref:ATP-dependent helicase/nuclease subunit B n=1 Tax=Halogranum rubrum TaxID=553466 RepID=A0A1I4AQ69_9EURY|nr:hypothetical protein [Halogranum rubrum]SFK58051.1 ATP-dependent helicase/nuclease subunit B [Halogranum rubrum]